MLDFIIGLVIIFFSPVVNFFTVPVFGAPILVNATSSRAPPPPSSMGNTAGGVSMSRALISDGGNIMSSTGSMAGGGLMSRALIFDGGSIMSSMGSMDGSTDHNRSMMIGLQGTS